jgi:hypothetical protein
MCYIAAKIHQSLDLASSAYSSYEQTNDHEKRQLLENEPVEMREWLTARSRVQRNDQQAESFCLMVDALDGRYSTVPS